MKYKSIRLGDYIERSTKNNKDERYGTELIVGVSNEGVFTSPKGNPEGVDLKPYKIVNDGAFVYNPSRLDLGSIAYRTEGMCIVSHLYIVFYLNDEGKKIIDPTYLFMYFRRQEFYREVRFRNFGSQRPEFNFNDMSEIIMPLPPLPVQQKYVAIYKAMIANQQSYERGLEDLKLVCDAYIEDLRRKMPCSKIGTYIAEVNERNTDLEISLVQGVNSTSSFDDTKANMTGIDLHNYKIVRKGQFAYNPSRINLGSIALLQQENCVISPMYIVFEVVDKEHLLPEYLMMWFSRKEFQRSTLFYASGSVRDTFDFYEMKEVSIPIPDISVQKAIAEIFASYNTRKAINERLKAQIKDLCPILIKGAVEEGVSS
ncbi:MAG: restriction endonuclease subunit S [Ruminococcus sp.]|nr:restriction endonuclease subunit S [Ruminococcus sp.]